MWNIYLQSIYSVSFVTHKNHKSLMWSVHSECCDMSYKKTPPSDKMLFRLTIYCLTISLRRLRYSMNSLSQPSLSGISLCISQVPETPGGIWRNIVPPTSSKGLESPNEIEYGTWKNTSQDPEETKPLSIIFENSCQSNGERKYLGKKMCKEGGWGEVKEGGGSFAPFLTSCWEETVKGIQRSKQLKEEQ